MTDKQCVAINNVDECRLVAMAAELAGQLEPPLVIYLAGPLGAGKTTFARAMIQALGYAGRVKSPTYSLVEQYPAGRITVVHIDLYRINDPAELEYLGLDEIPADAICLVEWPEHGRSQLPVADLLIKIEGRGARRNMVFNSLSQKAATLMESVAWSTYSN